MPLSELEVDEALDDDAEFAAGDALSDSRSISPSSLLLSLLPLLSMLFFLGTAAVLSIFFFAFFVVDLGVLTVLSSPSSLLVSSR